jgi:transposase
MMGRLNQDQGQLFYSFNHDEAVPGDHRVREIAAVLDLSWVHAELAPYYPSIGRPSIDPVLMIRLLILGYVFAIRSERQLCREVQVNLAYRWFCGLSIENRIPDHSAFSRARNERFRGSDIFRRVFERVVEPLRRASSLRQTTPTSTATFATKSALCDHSRRYEFRQLLGVATGGGRSAWLSTAWCEWTERIRTCSYPFSRPRDTPMICQAPRAGEARLDGHHF